MENIQTVTLPCLDVHIKKSNLFFEEIYLGLRTEIVLAENDHHREPSTIGTDSGLISINNQRGALKVPFLPIIAKITSTEYDLETGDFTIKFTKI